MIDLIKLIELLGFVKTSINDTDFYDLTESFYSYSISIQLPTTTVILRAANYRTDEHDSKVMDATDCFKYLSSIKHLKSKLRRKKIEKLLNDKNIK